MKLLIIIFFVCLGVALAQPPEVTYPDVAPIFSERCIICHNGPVAPRKLQLTSYENIMNGSENGAVVLPGQADGSELIKRIKGISMPRMPLTGPPYLSDEQIALIEQWVAQGAKEKPSQSAPPAAKKAPATVPETVPEPPVTKPANAFLTYSDVEPIFKMRCMKCHNTRGIMGPPPEGLLLNSYENILSSADRARVVPGYPEASELVRRIRGQALPRMPFDGPPYLSQAEIDLIIRWIEEGARDSKGKKAEVPVGAKVRLHGTLSGKWELDGLPLNVTGNTRIKKKPGTGDYVQVRGRLKEGGQIIVDRLRRR